MSYQEQSAQGEQVTSSTSGLAHAVRWQSRVFALRPLLIAISRWFFGKEKQRKPQQAEIAGPPFRLPKWSPRREKTEEASLPLPSPSLRTTSAIRQQREETDADARSPSSLVGLVCVCKVRVPQGSVALCSVVGGKKKSVLCGPPKKRAGGLQGQRRKSTYCRPPPGLRFRFGGAHVRRSLNRVPSFLFRSCSRGDDCCCSRGENNN